MFGRFCCVFEHGALSEEPRREKRVVLLVCLARCLVLAGILPATGCGPTPPALPPAQDKVLSPASRLGLVDLAGREVNPFQASHAKWLVFFFISVDCPISNRYAPEMRRLQQKFVTQGVEFWLVHPNADESAEEIRKHTEAYQYQFGVLRDPQHLLVKRAKVRVTPEAALFERAGSLVYGGSIDNRWLDFGQERPAATEHYLEQALEGVLRGKPVLHPRIKAIGCYIPNGDLLKEQ